MDGPLNILRKALRVPSCLGYIWKIPSTPGVSHEEPRGNISTGHSRSLVPTPPPPFDLVSPVRWYRKFNPTMISGCVRWLKSLGY